jgi:hypothetical protein
VISHNSADLFNIVSEAWHLGWVGKDVEGSRSWYVPFDVLFQHVPGGPQDTTEQSVQAAQFWDWTKDLPSTKQEWQYVDRNDRHRIPRRTEKEILHERVRRRNKEWQRKNKKKGHKEVYNLCGTGIGYMITGVPLRPHWNMYNVSEERKLVSNFNLLIVLTIVKIYHQFMKVLGRNDFRSESRHTSAIFIGQTE